MYILKEKTEEMASFTIGMDMKKYIDLDFDDEMEYISRQSRYGYELLSENDDRIIDCGNPLLARSEFLTMDDVNREFG